VQRQIQGSLHFALRGAESFGRDDRLWLGRGEKCRSLHCALRGAESFGRDDRVRRGASGAARGFRVGAGTAFVVAGVVHAFGELLEAGSSGAESGGAVTADLGHDLLVEVVGETAEFLFGTLGGFMESLI
jgi:hypothetical protein